MNQTTQSPLMNDTEAAKYLRVSPRTLWTSKKSGKIAFVQLGRKVFYRREALDRFIAERESTGPGRAAR